MGLLQSAKNDPKLDFFEFRDKNYWGKYKYRTRIFGNGIRFIYYSNNIIQFLGRINNTGYGQYGHISDSSKQSIIVNRKDFEKIIDLRKDFKVNKLGVIRVEGDTIAFFSNDLDSLHAIKSTISNPYFSVDCTEAKSDGVSGVKYFVRQPKYKFRVHFKSMTVNVNTGAEIQKFLNQYKQLKPSNSLQKWLSPSCPSWKKKYSSSTFSIDFDDESMLSIILIVFGDIIGHRFQLEKRPD